MAATDKPYRNQYRLDVVFGVSCVLLLFSVGWMMYDDHYRPFKPVQRKFRDVEEALYVQQMVEKYPQDRLDEIEAAQQEVKEARGQVEKEKEKVGAKVGGNAEAWLKAQALEKAKKEAEYQDTKANYDSEVSLYNIAVDERDAAPEGSAHQKKLADEAKAKKDVVNKLEKQLQDIQQKLTENENKTKEALADQREAEAKLAAAQDRLKKMTDDFDRIAKLAAQKRWKAGDWFRSLPIIDGFASAYKIQQVTLNDLTIEYGSFKDVPRYDRCTTCHLAIDRASFDPAALRNLDLAKKAKAQDKEPAELRQEYAKRHAAAVKFLKDRQKNDEAIGFDPGDLGNDVPSLALTEAQVKMYSAHPRLDLFVDSNSPHALEKFGCTTCHAGQGSATEFTLAAHTPDNPFQQGEWVKEHKWEPFHDWEFPMLPARFVESSCVKCHHQMTDLVRYGSQEEAPKLLRGYNLVKENGCFGCHEISGLKSGREVGPDLRLEPAPALDQLTADERARLLADTSNPPGTLRKVGPALRRLSEKTNEEWVRQWINSPRGFRPDTKMPHFYNLSTNSPDVLPGESDNNQKDFPATEISSIAHYLIAESQAYLLGNDRFRQFNLDRLKYLEDLQTRGLISDKQAKELVEVRRRLQQWQVPTPVALQIVDADGKPVPEDQVRVPGTDQDRLEGRRLFTERGCLACHSHAGTEAPAAGVVPVAGDAHFGPNLSRLAAKIKGDNGRRWLIQWIINPNVSHPRTRMPIMHLSAAEARQVADWLLSQEVKDWKPEDVPEPTKEMLVSLARVYLRKAPAVNPLKVDEVLEKGFTDVNAEAPQMADDADEQVLKGPIPPEKLPDRLKYYIGKKAVSRMGCFACHDVPGFEFAKPIGTPLNDWGKKDPARLAFEDIAAFVKEKYEVVKKRDVADPEDKAKTRPSDEWSKVVAEGKKPYEEFFFNALAGHTREGFLHQKIEDPRSYDYHRDLKWDDRLRMPQFKFAHSKRNKDESDDEFKARADMEEAEAREAVMTFILGLVAEPIHARYLSNPAPDRLAEAKGRQVLEKFNCAGCHLVRAGVYDVKLGADDREGGSRALLQESYRAIPKANFSEDIVFPTHNAWTGLQAPGADRLLLQAVNPRQRKIADRDLLVVRLTDAARFQSLAHAKDDPLIAYGAKGRATLDGERELLTVTAGNDVRLDPGTLVARSDPWGGTFANLLVPYLMVRNNAKYGVEDNARTALPPPLVREGERVQPEWLFGFLRNPSPVRPFTVLRMPKFNMSEDEAQAVVNYFAAADKINNPGIGLTYPYLSQPERRETYWQDRNRDYVKLLAKENALEKHAQTYLDDAEKALKSAKDGDKDKAALEADVKRVKEALGEKDAAKREALLAQSDLYWTDAYRLLTVSGDKAICQKCHAIGPVKASEDQGPALDLAFSRLRPDWTERWLGNPKRLLTYNPTMPQNFHGGNNEEFRQFFDAPSREKVQAVRDVLMNYPKVADLPVNRSYQPATPGGK